jgi:LysM repeat protein
MNASASRINYRRRRIVAVLFAIVALTILAFSVAQSQSARATASAGKADFTYIYVESGDTLWSIATKYAPDVDPQEEITNIQNLNNLSSSNLEPGQRLALP